MSGLPVMRAVVADDEPQALRSLRLALDGIEGVRVVGECSGGAQAIDVVRAEQPDVVFLDISMPEVDGFEVVRRLGPHAIPALVFVTAHEHEALAAFDVDAVDYVLKPFDDDRIERAVERARRRTGVSDPACAAPAAPADDADTRPLRRFLVRDGHRAVFVRVEDVDWIEADDKHVCLHVGPRQYRIRASLGAVERRLDPARFERVHRSRIVNVERVAELHAWFGGDYVAVLQNGTEIRVSRTYRGRLLRTLA